MDYTSLCRCCLSEKRENKNITSTAEFDDELAVILGVLQSCLNLQVNENDGLPQNICVFCLTNLQMAYSFKKIIEKSQSTLQQYLLELQDNSESCNFSGEDHRDDYVNEVNETLQNTEKPESCTVEVINIDYSFPNTHIYVPKEILKSKYSNEVGQCYFCTVCDSKFLEPSQLFLHCMEFHKSVSTVGKPCDYCNQKFPDFKSLLSHRRKHIMPFVCSLCSKGYFVLREFKMHKKTCKPVDETLSDSGTSSSRKVTCYICGKPYPVGYIKNHMLIHSEGSFKCKYCNRPFKQISGLNSHILFFHKKEKSHNCDICNAVFMTVTLKNRHVRKVHKAERNVVCHICDKKFFSKSDLKRHNFTHTGSRNYGCVHCNKIYQTRYGLGVHLKSHQMKVS